MKQQQVKVAKKPRELPDTDRRTPSGVMLPY